MNKATMRRYLINGRFTTQQTTGVQRFAMELLQELDKIVEPGELILAIPTETLTVPVFKNIETRKVGHLKGIFWEQVSYALFCLINGYTPLNLCNSSPLISPGIITIHDVKIKTHPEFFTRKFLIWYRIMLKISMRKSRMIITVSDFSKKEIMNFYNVDNSKIIVVYNGWQHFDRVGFDEKTLEKYNLKKEGYFFSISSMDPNKNFRWIAEKARSMNESLFVVAGSINKKVFSEEFDFECPSNLRFLGYVTDGEAKTLMRDCKVFLFPSIYEGFGIPPLEAMSCGCKRIVVSDTEVMHEVYGNSVTYIHDGMDINNISESDTKDILSKYGWARSAQILKEVLLSDR